eukprot:evm.model.scf_219.3 EVM.evm.TU.scf_219.3   scf_219:22913-23287(-)
MLSPSATSGDQEAGSDLQQSAQTPEAIDSRSAKSTPTRAPGRKRRVSSGAESGDENRDPCGRGGKGRRKAGRKGKGQEKGPGNGKGVPGGRSAEGGKEGGRGKVKGRQGTPGRFGRARHIADNG